VDTFPYLPSLITEDGECTTKFRTRIYRGQAIGASLQKIWKSHSIPISTKMRLMKALVWPVATYGCENCTLRKNEETRLDVFEMKGLRKTLRVSWTAKKTNEWILNKAGVKRELLDTVKARKLAYYRHTMRKQGSCLEKQIMQGTMPGARNGPITIPIRARFEYDSTTIRLQHAIQHATRFSCARIRDRIRESVVGVSCMLIDSSMHTAFTVYLHCVSEKNKTPNSCP